MPITLLYSEDLKEYDFGPGHPFRGDRYIQFFNFLTTKLVEGKDFTIISANPAEEKDLLMLCHHNFIEFTRGYYESANLGISYPGRFSEFHSMDNIPTGKPGRIEEAARLVVGQAKLACQLIQEGKLKQAISIGGGLHHAKRNYGEGFCLYNDVAFAALYLLDHYKLERILILDTDAHDGNGTEQYFMEEPRVLVIDIHQDPLTIYPATGFASQIGTGAGKGFTVNIPMPEYSSDDCYRLAFEAIIEPVAAEFKPQIIIRNGGSDPHFADGLTNLGLTMQGFTMIGEKVRKLSGICDNKLIDMIASGYNREILPYAWLALIAGLADIKIAIEDFLQVPPEIRDNIALPATKDMIEEVKRYLKPYWKCLH